MLLKQNQHFGNIFRNSVKLFDIALVSTRFSELIEICAIPVKVRCRNAVTLFEMKQTCDLHLHCMKRSKMCVTIAEIRRKLINKRSYLAKTLK